MTNPKSETVKAWTRLISAHKRLMERVERELKSAGYPPLSWYDALLEIEKAEESGIRPYTLQDRLLLPQSGMSRLLDRLEKEGLVRREICTADGRGQIIHLTESGAKLRKDMWIVYSKFLTDALEEPLRIEGLNTLSSLLARVLDSDAAKSKK